ncbi:MAG TPA: energy transducer TonB [Pyrinomonadaceae bacterium]|jgi:TonB family protein
MKALPLVVLALLAVPARVPQPARAQGGVSHFSKDGLSFDYPDGWTLEDKSRPELQHLILRRPGTTALVMVVAQRELLQTVAQMLESRNTVTKPYVANVARLLGAEVPDANDSKCMPLRESNAVGFRMTGQIGGEQGAGEVYAVVMGQRLTHLVHARADRDDAASAPGWKAVLDTLRIEPPATPSPDAREMEQVVAGGVLNGKAVEKPQPWPYPVEAKAAGAQGPVSVHILVDETGKVVHAQAISGHRLLRDVSERAARRAKFSPTTLCGKPMKVMGTITYNFVLQRR